MTAAGEKMGAGNGLIIISGDVDAASLRRYLDAVGGKVREASPSPDASL